MRYQAGLSTTDDINDDTAYIMSTIFSQPEDTPVMPLESTATRPRNAQATRSAILEAARARFAQDGYDHVGVRDIASDAGVNAALVSRYFGSKEELFAEVLDLSERNVYLLDGSREGLADRAANAILEPQEEGRTVENLLIMLRSMTSPTASAVVQEAIVNQFDVPAAALLGGECAEQRSRLLGSVVFGLILTKMIRGDVLVSAEKEEKVRARIMELVELATKEL